MRSHDRTPLRALALVTTSLAVLLTGAPHGSASAPESPDAENPVLIGATVYQNAPRTSVSEEIAWLEAEVGALEIRRVFDSGFSQDFMIRAGLDVGHRATHYSFKPDMAQLAAGTQDDEIMNLINSIPAGHRTLLTIWHEPEDNFTTDATQATYRAGWQRFGDLVHNAGRPELTTSWVMMSYSWWVSSGRDPMNWYPGDAYVDSVGIDTYNEGSLNKTRWDSPGRGMGLPFEGDTAVPGGYVYGGAIRWAQARGIEWGLAELGSLENEAGIDSGWAEVDEKGRWIRRAMKFYVAEGASYIEYFHCGPYRGPWWLDSSQDALDAFKWALKTY